VLGISRPCCGNPHHHRGEPCAHPPCCDHGSRKNEAIKLGFSMLSIFSYDINKFVKRHHESVCNGVLDVINTFLSSNI